MNGEPYKAGKFASSIRENLYREHLGLFKKMEYSVQDPLSDEMIVSLFITIHSYCNSFQTAFTRFQMGTDPI